MRRNMRTFAAGIAVIAALAAGGAAFTASNTIPNSVAGYGSSTISGATATALTYTRSLDGSTITAANLTFDGDQSARAVKAGFGSDALSACTVGAYDEGSDSTPVTCGGFTQSVADALTFNVSVS
jgi:hypothetical protein